MTIPPIDASVIACTQRDCCTRAAKAWTGCNKPSINGASLHSNVIQHCLCSGLEFPGWSGLLSEYLGCLENGNSFINQFQYLLPAFCPVNPTLTLSKFETQAYSLRIREQFPLLLPNATLIDWNNTHPFGYHQVTAGGVLDEPQDGFIGDHLPVHIKTERAMPLTHDCAVPTATPVLSPNPFPAQVCQNTSCCPTCRDRLRLVLEPHSQPQNNTVTWNCLCKAYNTMWMGIVNDCAMCMQPSLPSTATGTFTSAVTVTMNAFCNFTTPSSSTSALLALGSHLRVQYQSPLLFFNMTIPTGPVHDAGP